MKIEILAALLEIAKTDKGNILFLLSPNSYNDYIEDRESFSSYIKGNMRESMQRLNSSDTSSSTVFKNIVSDFEAAKAETDLFDRLVKSIFTKNREELDDLASKCLALNDVSVYIL